ncbi:MAG: lipopolysaccharide heptosyltransferase II [Vicinamibacterales bacterium]
MQRLVVLAPNWLGDAVMALPAVADLRRHFGGARLAVAARLSVAALFTMVPGIDEVLELTGRGGLAAVSTWRDDVSAVAGGGFDLAILLPNSFASALTVSRAGVPERWGLATDARTRLLTRSAPKPPKGLHQAGYYQALVAAFGVANGPMHARVDAPAHVRPPAPDGRFVVLAPGAAYGKAKQWPEARFAELATLIRRDGRAVAVIGSRADLPTATAIADAAGAGSGAPVVNLAGRTSLAELASLMARADAVVSNDSGAMHLAGAVGAPVVAIFGATNEHRTSPLTRDAQAAAPRIMTAEAWCRPCMLRECPIDHRCMTGVSAAAVFEALGPGVPARGRTPSP